MSTDSPKRILLTGMSGTGKSTLIQRLRAAGYCAWDVDDEGWTRRGPDGGWIWREDLVERLLDEHSTGTLFLSGCAESQVRFYPRFDQIILLSAPAAVLRERLRRRTNNSYGKRPEELADVLAYLKTVEPKLRQAADHEVDAVPPPDDVFNEILHLVGEPRIISEYSSSADYLTGATPMSKVTPFLMFNDQLESAIAFYTATFPDSEVRNVARTGEDGSIASAEFVVGGQVFMGYNGGPHFAFSDGFSLFVDCEDQAEVDRYWEGLLKAGAEPSRCGWITDPFGLSWQIVPRRFTELIAAKDAKKVEAVMETMMSMVKLDVDALQRAYDEA